MLRGRLVCGIHDQGIQRRLLQQTDLTFDKALEVALAAEAAEKTPNGSLMLTLIRTSLIRLGRCGTSHLPASLEPLSGGSHRSDRVVCHPQHTTTSAGKGDCSRCGGKHESVRCRYRQYECHHCKKMGHLACVCRKKGQQQTDQQQTHHVAEAEVSTTNPNSSQTYSLFHVSSGQSAPLLSPSMATLCRWR